MTSVGGALPRGGYLGCDKETSMGGGSATTRWAGAAVGLLVVIPVGIWLGQAEPPCIAQPLSTQLERSQMLVGGSFDDATFAAQPFTLRYQYIAGGIPETACDDCRTCSVGGVTCKNPSECGWWGCWQADDQPPGLFPLEFVKATSAGGAVPMLTYYNWFYVSGGQEGEPEIAALGDEALVVRYLNDFRRLCGRLGSSGVPDIILHVEPDLWAFARKHSEDASQIPVNHDCDTSKDLPGLVECMRQIAGDAPGIRFALHASAWDSNADALLNADPSFDLPAHAQGTGRFLRQLGADQDDLIVVEMHHRDAGATGRWWDASDQTLPNFTQAIAWSDAVSRDLGVPHLWWQLPYGNESLDNTCGRYADNRAGYIFDHPERFATGASLGVAFGAGAECMTTPATDDGYFHRRVAALLASPPDICR